jgi:hypothetical protein
MESTLKHIYFRDRYRDGRIAVKLESNILTVKSLTGKLLPAEYLFAVLDVALGKEWRIEAEKLHKMRSNPWRIKTKQHLGGQRIILQEMIEPEMAEVIDTAEIYVSSFWEIPRFKLHLKNLAPLAAKLSKLYPQTLVNNKIMDSVFRQDFDDGSFLIIELWKPCAVGVADFNAPGTSSTLAVDEE